MSPRALPPRLVALTPATLCDARQAGALRGSVERAFAAGLPGLLLREPLLADRAFFELGQELATLARAADAWFAVHDRVHVALALEAQGVHLGFRSLAPDVVRGLVGEATAIGSSAHAGDEPGRHAQADYLFAGPVRPTPSKAGLVETLGFDGLGELVGAHAAPVWAIGGLRPEDVSGALAAGARGVAVLSGILGAADPGQRCAAYLDACTQAEGA